jgi:DNA-binding XRE family transcriptional regulator
LSIQAHCITFPATMADPIPEYDKELVGKRIVDLRAAKSGMAQNTLAAAIEITPQKLWNYESGTDQLPLEHAAKICAVTGANFDYLYRGILGTLPPDLLAAILEVRKAPPKRRARRA